MFPKSGDYKISVQKFKQLICFNILQYAERGLWMGEIWIRVSLVF
jgi:hypothetical protein